MSPRRIRYSLWYAFKDNRGVSQRIRVEELSDDEPSVCDIQDEIVRKEKLSCAVSTIILEVKAPEGDQYNLLNDALFHEHEENFITFQCHCEAQKDTISVGHIGKGHEGFKQFFIAEFFNEDTKAEAMELASKRTSIFVDMKKAIITDDLDLQRMLKVMVTAGTLSFNVSLETLSKAFTDFKFQEVCHLFGIFEDENPSLSAFPVFNCDTRTIDWDQVAKQHLVHLINDLKVYNIVNLVFLMSFLVAAVCYFKEDIILRPQKKLCGRHGHGPVDFALESHHQLGHKHKWNEVDEDTASLEETYGIVTDAEKWYFLHCKVSDNKGAEFGLSKPPITVDWFGTVEKYRANVKMVLEHILWLLCKMEEAEADTGI
ncbi:10985_t:CDS:2, partial [Paraglomus brasilianum]